MASDLVINSRNPASLCHYVTQARLIIMQQQDQPPFRRGTFELRHPFKRGSFRAAARRKTQGRRNQIYRDCVSASFLFICWPNTRIAGPSSLGRFAKNGTRILNGYSLVDLASRNKYHRPMALDCRHTREARRLTIISSSKSRFENARLKQWPFYCPGDCPASVKSYPVQYFQGN